MLDTSQGVLLLGHGSKRKEANESLDLLTQSLRKRLGTERVEHGFLQLASPDFFESAERLLQKGCTHILVIPFFLVEGNHFTKDIPQHIERLLSMHPSLKVDLSVPLGSDRRLMNILEERVLSHFPMQRSAFLMNPEEIEKESMRLIEERLYGEVDLALPELSVTKRVIHATGDLDFAKTMRFHPQAVKAGTKALREGCAILTDVTMVMAGIMKRYKNPLSCFIAHEEVAQRSKEQAKSRAAIAMEEMAPLMTGSVVAIGNAPTALLQLLELTEKKLAEPALVVATPVGFVGASEAKELLTQSPIPFITNQGRKGGSSIACAIVNALLLMAWEEGKGGKPLCLEKERGFPPSPPFQKET